MRRPVLALKAVRRPSRTSPRNSAPPPHRPSTAGAAPPRLTALLALPHGGGTLERELAGRSSQRRPIQLYAFGPADAHFRILVVGCIHGNECAGTAITRRLL